MTRFVGYLNRRPYLWFVDCETKEIWPAADLKQIPQGIDEVVVITDAVAVGCGPTWFGLASDLSGPPLPLSSDELEEVGAVKAVVEWPELPRIDDPTLHLPLRNGESLDLNHPAVDHWAFGASWSPDGRYVALDGCTVPFRRPRSDWLSHLSAPIESEPHVLALADTEEGHVRIFDGTFDQFTYPPAWTMDGSEIYLGAPFEPKRIYRANFGLGALEPIVFRRHVPTPMLDAALLAVE